MTPPPGHTAHRPEGLAGVVRRVRLEPARAHAHARFPVGRGAASGNTALAALHRLGLSAVLIDTAEPGFAAWLQEIDVAFLAIAGQYAEDGKLQGLLEHSGIPCTGSGVLAGAPAMHKTAGEPVRLAAY